MSVCPYVTSRPITSCLVMCNFQVGSQSIPNKSCFVCVKSEKYAFLVTLRPLGSIRWGETKLRTLHYWAWRNWATYIKTHFSISSSPQCRSQAVVFVSTPRMYLRSRYFLVKYDSLILILKIPLIDGFPIFWLGDCWAGALHYVSTANPLPPMPCWVR